MKKMPVGLWITVSCVQQVLCWSIITLLKSDATQVKLKIFSHKKDFFNHF